MSAEQPKYYWQTNNRIQPQFIFILDCRWHSTPQPKWLCEGTTRFQNRVTRQSDNYNGNKSCNILHIFNNIIISTLLVVVAPPWPPQQSTHSYCPDTAIHSSLQVPSICVVYVLHVCPAWFDHPEFYRKPTSPPSWMPHYVKDEFITSSTFYPLLAEVSRNMIPFWVANYWPSSTEIFRLRWYGDYNTLLLNQSYFRKPTLPHLTRLIHTYILTWITIITYFLDPPLHIIKGLRTSNIVNDYHPYSWSIVTTDNGTKILLTSLQIFLMVYRIPYLDLDYFVIYCAHFWSKFNTDCGVVFHIHFALLKLQHKTRLTHSFPIDDQLYYLSCQPW